MRGDVTTVTWDEDLEPQQIYVLARHGSRHFGDDSVEMAELVEFLLVSVVLLRKVITVLHV